MSFPLIPDIMLREIYDLTPEFFTSRGIRLAILDVDNTLAPYGTDTPDPRLLPWTDALRRAGVEAYILSNNRGRRPAIFAEALGIGCTGSAGKPFVGKLRALLAQKGLDARDCALIGDQIYTDVLCAKSAGATAVLVEPIELSNILLKLRYALELPFRAIYKRRRNGK